MYARLNKYIDRDLSWFYVGNFIKILKVDKDWEIEKAKIKEPHNKKYPKLKISLNIKVNKK